MRFMIRFILPIGLFLLFILPNTVFVVREWEQAVRFQFGEILEIYQKPGLYWKVPFIQNVTVFDGRLQTLDTQPERYLTREKKNLIVDTFVKWRIQDPGFFYKTVRGDVITANTRLDQIIKDGLRSEFGRKDLQDVVAGFDEENKQTTRTIIQDRIVSLAQQEGKRFGVEVIDVRIKRIELPPDVLDNVFTRMRTERERVAREFRARGEAVYIETRAQADRQRTVMLAEAFRDAEKIRGEGDAKAAQIYAESFSKNPQFFSFYRSMQAYRQAFKQPSDLMVLEPDSDFFRYFKSAQPRTSLSQ